MTELRSEQGHIASLNLLRGFAALSVCCFHLLGGERFADYPVIQSIFHHGYIGLLLFFLISGFVIPYAMYMNNYHFLKFPKFLLKRAIRIEIPYIVSFCLIILVGMIIDHEIYHKESTMDWKRFGLHFFYLNQYFGKDGYSGVYWTLAIEFQYYLIIGLIFPLLISKYRIISLLTLLVCGYFCWSLILPYNWFIFQYGYLFIAGITVFMYKVNYISWKLLLPALAILSYMSYTTYGVDHVCVILIGSFAILAINKEWKVTNFFGKISFSLYLVHCEASSFLMAFIMGYVTNYSWITAIAFCFAILFAIGFYYAVERPALRLSKRVSYK